MADRTWYCCVLSHDLLAFPLYHHLACQERGKREEKTHCIFLENTLHFPWKHCPVGTVSKYRKKHWKDTGHTHTSTRTRTFDVFKHFWDVPICNNIYSTKITHLSGVFGISHVDWQTSCPDMEFRYNYFCWGLRVGFWWRASKRSRSSKMSVAVCAERRRLRGYSCCARRLGCELGTGLCQVMRVFDRASQMSLYMIAIMTCLAACSIPS